MRKIIFEIGMSLDGFIEGINGDLDWMIRNDEIAYVNSFFSRFDTIFYGRITYEKLGTPRPIDADVVKSEAEREFNKHVNNMRKYVFSRTVKHVAGNGMVVGANLESEVKRIKDERGKNIWFCGGAKMLLTFIELDLIDEYQIVVHPIILGAGKPLFNLMSRLDFNLRKTQKLKSGVVILHYEPRSRKQ